MTIFATVICTGSQHTSSITDTWQYTSDVTRASMLPLPLSYHLCPSIPTVITTASSPSIVVTPGQLSLNVAQRRKASTTPMIIPSL